MPRFEIPCIHTRGEVSADWSRCPGSMARRSRDSGSPLRRISAGWMKAKIGRFCAGFGRMQWRYEGGKGGAFPRVPFPCGCAESLRRAQKSLNSVTSTFFNAVHFLPKDLMFEHRAPKLFLPQVQSNLVTPLDAGIQSQFARRR